MTLIAYHNNPALKAGILATLADHAAHDRLIKGTYWEGGKGCAVGCTIQSGDHAEYEPRFGVPQVLARLEDTIFEGLPNARAMAWPVAFMSAIQPGADLSRVGWRFLAWLLTDEGVNPGITHPLVRDAVRRCADLMADLAEGKAVSREAADAARSAADAARSAAYAARSAADAARSAADAARSAADAAWSAADAAWSAADAARSAAYAARSAAYAAGSAADAAGSAAYAAGSAAYERMANKLLELLASAPAANDNGAVSAVEVA